MEMISLKKVLSIALALVMIFALSATVFAEDATEHMSPTVEEFYKIDVKPNPSDGHLGDATADNYTVIRNSDGTVTLTANPKGDGEFDKWIIDGEYEVIEGSLTDPTITIKPKSDIDAIASFKDTTAPATEPASTAPTTSPKTDGGATSPKTGDPLFLIISLAALALGVGVFAVKKIKE